MRTCIVHMQKMISSWPPSLAPESLLEPPQNLDEKSCVDSLTAHKFMVHYAFPVTESKQHALADRPGSPWEGWSLSSSCQPLGTLHLGKRIVHVYPCFIHGYQSLHDVGVPSDVLQHQLGALQSLPQMVGCQCCRHKACAPPAELEVIG